MNSNSENRKGIDFIRRIVEEDLKNGKNSGKVSTRFPPEPNGYLHIGHAKSICLNFWIAQEFKGTCNLRFDDTNPEKEEEEYVRSIQEDIKWLGFDWGERLYFASDYFEQYYKWAIELVEAGKAYVDSLGIEEIKEMRGTPMTTGKPSPYRERSVDENLDLFKKMRDGHFNEGEAVLRAKIDMTHPNINMRDPVIYRIRKASHHRTGDSWCIYPMYDFAHGYEDAIEGITHSICTLEFEHHRPLYNWFIENVSTSCHPRQIEFAKLKLTSTVMSKRNLRYMVEEGIVRGWDDPRMPTLSGVRRRGFTPSVIQRLCREVGVSKVNSMVDLEFLNFLFREEFNKTAPRVMAVLKPLKVVIENYPEEQTEMIEAENNPEDPAMLTRDLPFSREIYIEEEDFMEEPPSKYFRLSPGREVRLKHTYYITCQKVIKDSSGKVVELRCTYDPESKGGTTPDKRKVKGTLHWVSALHAQKATVRLYEPLFTQKDMENLDEGQVYTDFLNPNSLVELTECRVEPSLVKAPPESHFQFFRHGYFCADRYDHSSEAPVFNRTTVLKDSWAKIKDKGS